LIKIAVFVKIPDQIRKKPCILSGVEPAQKNDDLLPVRALLSALMREVRIRADVAPIRAADLGMVIYFTDDRLYRGKKYGSADLALQFSGIRVDEQGGPVRHGLLISSCESAGLPCSFLPRGTIPVP
jgi:hypothetical protein